MRTWLALAACGALALGASACGGDDKSGGGSGGNIRIDGSSTVQPFVQAAIELYKQSGSDTKITVAGAGTGDGFEKFCRGETQIADASRPIEEDETKLCSQKKIKPVEVQVANDGITVVGSKQLGAECLTTDQLKEVFNKGSKVKTLSEVDSKLPDTELALFTPGEESGTFDFFTEEINGEEAVQRTEGIQKSPNDNTIVTGVSGEDGGLGYFGFSFFDQNRDKLDAISLDAGSGCVEPSLETIQSGEYKPLSRPLYMYPSEDSLKKPEVKEFMTFINDNYDKIAKAAKIVPMNDTQAGEAKTAIGG